MQNCIIASSSSVHGSAPLEYMKQGLIELFSNTQEILFIPYAQPSGMSFDQYTSYTAKIFEPFDKHIIGIHTFDNPATAIENAQGIYTGGGNTFVLVNNLYKNDLLTPLKKVIQNGTPYLGTSAGSNICGLSMRTTNDMPIVYPPSFKTLGIVPFNINPHYLDPDPNSKHKGETRETRIKEFHKFNTSPVIGLREGSWIQVTGQDLFLRGNLSARIFEPQKTPFELATNTNLNHIY